MRIFSSLKSTPPLTVQLSLLPLVPALVPVSLLHSDAQGAGTNKGRHGCILSNWAKLVRAKPVGAVDRLITLPSPTAALLRTTCADSATTRDIGNSVA